MQTVGIRHATGSFQETFDDSQLGNKKRTDHVCSHVIDQCPATQKKRNSKDCPYFSELHSGRSISRRCIAPTTNDLPNVLLPFFVLPFTQ